MINGEAAGKGRHYILLASLAFAGLGVEALFAFALEPALYEAELAEWSTTQTIIHWCITCIAWGTISYLLIRFAKIKLDFDIFAKGDKLRTWQWGLLALCIIFMLTVSYIDWNGFKIVKEFIANGALKFTFQYIYYFFETILLTLIIVFGQNALEKWFHRINIPYGGLIAAVTWGLAHIFTKGSITTGLLCALSGLIYGSIYLLANRNVKVYFPILLICFIL